ncbi:cadherin repeat domain-containing protein [Granulicella sp. dw_53]|uniref:cadherin repeat domain-containing protein n=1 Tax=Granulicella sp. dw_53 TaxID=2719792 RepID=UPI001BD4551B|nr:cadherin repeat domain-containing protein [Granulicella sp. dw_53]
MKGKQSRTMWVAAALLLILGYPIVAAAQRTPDCSVAPWNVPTGNATAATTAAQDQQHMLCIQGLRQPDAASNPSVSATRVGDPHAPVNAWPGTVASPEASNWTDALGHVVVRWGWGLWTTYDDSQSGGTANVLCNGTSPCTPALEKSTSTGGSMSGYGDYGLSETTSNGQPIVGARPYPTGNAPLGPGGTTICTSPGCLATGSYTPIDIFTMKDGVTKITKSKDWWLKRRPELMELVQKEMYGYKIPDSVAPAITWTIGGVTTGTQTGTIGCITSGTTCPGGTITDGKTYAYRAKTYTGTVSIDRYPAVRNRPSITVNCRFPANATGKVPVFIGIGGANTLFQYTAPLGYGACGYSQTALQADAGGAATTSYLSGLINQGNWRQPTDAGTLQIWAWGVSRIIDEFGSDPDPIGPDPDKVAVEGHSRNGKATLVAAAMDDRVVAALPSCGGAGGAAPIRRHFGESIESIVGSGEYYWMDGYLMNYAGPACQTNPSVGKPGCTPAFFPRKVQELDVDAPEVMSLVAPRAIMTNGGTDTPNGGGDAWQDPRGMYLSGAVSGPVWQLLGWPGQVIPADTIFTSNPTSYTNGESIGGTPPFNTAFIDGTVGWRRHSQGHTDVPEWPVFVTFASKYLNDVRPVITAGQVFTLPASSSVVGEVKGTDGGGGHITNWQIKGGDGAYAFDIDSATGQITVADRTKLNGASSYVLTLMASDGILPAHDTTVTINAPAAVVGTIQLITTTSLLRQIDGSYLATVTVKNMGTGTAKDVALTSSVLGAASGTPIAQALISIPPAGIAVATVIFPASAGNSGAAVIQKIMGTYTGGAFGGSSRAILP